MRTALFWVIMQQVVVIYYQCFETTYWSHHKSQNPKDKMGPIGCPKTLVRNDHYMLHCNTEQCSYQLLLKFQLTPHFNPNIISLAIHIHTKLQTQKWYST